MVKSMTKGSSKATLTVKVKAKTPRMSPDEKRIAGEMHFDRQMRPTDGLKEHTRYLEFGFGPHARVNNSCRTRDALPIFLLQSRSLNTRTNARRGRY